MRNRLNICCLILVASTASCDSKALAGAEVRGAYNYGLECDSTDTAEQSLTFCMRIDTRTGEVLRVEQDKLPRSNGPTQAATGPAGTYQLACDSANTATKADLSCLRLHRVTGEILLIALPKVGTFPSSN